MRGLEHHRWRLKAEPIECYDMDAEIRGMEVMT